MSVVRSWAGVVLAVLLFSQSMFGQDIAATCDELDDGERDYRLLATKKTSTMETELNAAASTGFRLEDLMGGETAFGGSEVVVVMCRPAGLEESGMFEYRLLATKKTSTMQRELQAAGEEGFEYVGQTVFETAFGGREVVVILERRTDPAEPTRLWDYRLLATKKTSTMQEELAEAGRDGFALVGVTVSPTFIGGDEVVAILRRPRPGSDVETVAGGDPAH